MGPPGRPPFSPLFFFSCATQGVGRHYGPRSFRCRVNLPSPPSPFPPKKVPPFFSPRMAFSFQQAEGPWSPTVSLFPPEPLGIVLRKRLLFKTSSPPFPLCFLLFRQSFFYFDGHTGHPKRYGFWSGPPLLCPLSPWTFRKMDFLVFSAGSAPRSKLGGPPFLSQTVHQGLSFPRAGASHPISRM